MNTDKDRKLTREKVIQDAEQHFLGKNFDTAPGMSSFFKLFFICCCAIPFYFFIIPLGWGNFEFNFWVKKIFKH
jgi:hypothetical protein